MNNNIINVRIDILDVNELDKNMDLEFTFFVESFFSKNSSFIIAK